MVNKAHSAVVRRIKVRYGGVSGEALGIDIVTESLRIEVETSATLESGIERLSAIDGIRYVAVTNKEAIPDALRIVDGTGIGVMDSYGNVLVPAKGANEAPNGPSEDRFDAGGA
jgi:hypothetical protein